MRRPNTTFGTITRSPGTGVPIITAETAKRLIEEEDTERRKDQTLGDAMLDRRVEPDLFEGGRERGERGERGMVEGVVDEPEERIA
jgi:hypothetical protein